MPKNILVEENNIPWKILSILNVKLPENHLKKCERYLAYVIRVVSIASTLHSLSSDIYRICTKKTIDMRVLAYLLMGVEFILFSYFMSINFERISIVLKKLYIYRIYLKQRNNKELSIKAVVIAFLLLPIVIAVIISISHKRENTSFYSYGHEVRNKSFVHAVVFSVNFAYYFCCSILALNTILLSVVFFRLGEVLSVYNKYLCSYVETGNINTSIFFFKEIL